jgi:hypothetical protein
VAVGETAVNRDDSVTYVERYMVMTSFEAEWALTHSTYEEAVEAGIAEGFHSFTILKLWVRDYGQFDD